MKKYNIIFETAPSKVYKTEEEINMIVKKGTDLLIRELIINKINKEMERKDEVRKKITD